MSKLALITDRRAALERPYQREHDQSVQTNWNRGGKPTGLYALVAWFVKGWDLEPPDELHASGPWFGGAMDQVDGQPVRISPLLAGGSVLGAPRWSEPFRAWLTASPCALDADGFYRWPMRSAVYRLGVGSPRRDPRPIGARYCFALGQVRGDWQLMNARSAFPVEEEILRAFWADTLTELWYLYRAANGR